MSGNGEFFGVEKRRLPWWLWPNLLSLDAPLVAVAWMWMFTRFWYVSYVDPAVYWVLAGVVWSIYVMDRLRDVKKGDSEVRERHHFHWKHRKLLRGLVFLVLLACVAGFFLGVPFSMLWDWPRGLPLGVEGIPLRVYIIGFLQGALTHGVVVLIFTAGFFLVSRTQKSNESMDSVLLKNGLAALTFAYGTAMGAHFYTYRGVVEMIFSFEAIAFAMLCLMNINAIDLWEREEERQEDLPSRELLLTLPLLVLGFLSLLAASFWHEYRQPFYYSILLSSAGLLMLDHFRTYISARLMRVLADVALLLPLPIFWFWFRN